jgi:hypothetical protein
MSRMSQLQRQKKNAYIIKQKIKPSSTESAPLNTKCITNSQIKDTKIYKKRFSHESVNAFFKKHRGIFKIVFPNEISTNNEINIRNTIYNSTRF